MARLITQLHDDAKQLGRAFGQQRMKFVVVLFVFGATGVAVVRIVYPSIFSSILSDLFISILGAIFGVYVSIELLLPYVRHVERTRIDSAEEIVNSYSEPIASTFISLRDRPKLSSSSFPDRIPVTVEHLPDGYRSYDSLDCSIDLRTHYAVPDELYALFEPEDTELEELFRQEKRTNGRKARLEWVSDSAFVCSVTTYYRSFLTNFCPDYVFDSGDTVRSLSEPLLFEDDSVRPIADTPFSDHFGGGLLVVTTDGRALVPIRSRSVAVEGKAVHLSCSGSFDVEDVDTGGIDEAFRSIITAETTVDRSQIRSIAYLGTTRRIERLGKPDTIGIALVDPIDPLDITTTQFVRGNVVDVFPSSIDSVDSIEDLFDPDVACHIVDSVATAAENEPYRPSLGLCSWLAIYPDVVHRG